MKYQSGNGPGIWGSIGVLAVALVACGGGGGSSSGGAAVPVIGVSANPIPNPSPSVTATAAPSPVTTPTKAPTAAPPTAAPPTKAPPTKAPTAAPSTVAPPTPVPTPIATPTPTAAPTPGALSAAPTAFTFAGVTAAPQTVTLTQSNHTGLYTYSSCTDSGNPAVTVATASQIGASSVFSLTPVAGGTCTLTFGGDGQTAAITVSVGQTVNIIVR